MKTLITIAILGLLLLLGLRQVASRSFVETRAVEKCTIPRKFEGKIKLSVKTTGLFGGTRQAFGTGTIHVDATNGRGAIFETVYAHGQTTKINVIMREVDKKTTAYYDIPELRLCLKKQINAPLLPGTVPKNGTLHVREGVLGGVPVQIWEFDVKEGEKQAHAEIYLTHDKCMPEALFIKASGNGESLMATKTFTAMKYGIEDESVFDIPEYCLKSRYHLGAHSTLEDSHQSVHHGGEYGYGVNRHHDWHLNHAVTRHRVRHQHIGV